MITILLIPVLAFFPGIPIWKRKDLAHWQQIGYVLDRKSQLHTTYEMMSAGIFAPTIRYHEGVVKLI